jgi:Bacteriophage related domain of unknown function
MATDFVTATDEINEIVYAAWLAGAQLAISSSYVPELEFEDTVKNKTAPATGADGRAFGRVTIRHASAGQRTLGGEGRRVFTNVGVVIVQVFTPRDDGTSRRKCQLLADVVKRSMQGQRTANVWFRNVTFNEVGDEDQWYHINVSAEFEWDELR